MLLFNDPSLLYHRRKSYSLPEYLWQHARQIHDFQLQDGQEIARACKYLSRELGKHARSKSPVYLDKRGVIDKSGLADKSDWYVPGYETHDASTGGSTTGEPFRYLRWATHYRTIEGEAHYRAVLKEFNLDRPLQLLYLMLDLSEDRHSDQLVKVYKTGNALISHGQGQATTVHEVVWNRRYYNDYFGFYEELLHYCKDHAIDVIMAPGQIVTALAWNSRRLKWKDRLCALLSNTGNKVDRTDLDFLKQSGLVGDWCDHMRCWDGGITFMTCRHHTYHLLDGLAWVRSDRDGRLISDDYYSLPSPFVNYWNGDYGTVGTDYKRCECGRSYRDFKISRTRSVVMAGVHNREIRDRILASGIDATDIKRAEGFGSFIRLFTNKPLSGRDRMTVRRALPSLEINFITEEPN